MLFKLPKPMFEADGGQGGAGSSDGEPSPTSEPKAEPKTENMIPKSRFDEINNKYKEVLEKLQSYEAAEAEREKKLKEEQGKFQELYETANKELGTYKETTTKYETRVKELEAVIETLVKNKLETVPKEFHDLIPSNLTAEQTLEWLSKAEAKGLFAKSEPKEIGKPMNHSNETPKVDKANMSPLDKILAGLR